MTGQGPGQGQGGGEGGVPLAVTQEDCIVILPNSFQEHVSDEGRPRWYAGTYLIVSRNMCLTRVDLDGMQVPT